MFFLSKLLVLLCIDDDVLLELYPLVPFVPVELIAESVYLQLYIGAATAWLDTCDRS